MTDTVIDFPAKAAPGPIDLPALSDERAQLVLRIRAIDTTFAEEFERRGASFEEISQVIVMTSSALPSLPVGMREEARQAGESLPAIMRRFLKLFRPLGAEPPEAA